MRIKSSINVSFIHSKPLNIQWNRHVFMTKDIEKYRAWVRQGQHSRSAAFYYLGKAILEELGEEKGTELIIKQVKEMGKASGTNTQNTLMKQGLNNDAKHFFDRSMAPDNLYAFAWVGETTSVSEDERFVDWKYCPIAEGFKILGDEGVKIGELFCNYIDDAVVQAYNSDYECIRESSLNLDGLCRLHFKPKDNPSLLHTVKSR